MNAFVSKVSALVGSFRNNNERKLVERAYSRQLSVSDAVIIVLASR